MRTVKSLLINVKANEIADYSYCAEILPIKLVEQTFVREL